jgi:tellurite methyltransferase
MEHPHEIPSFDSTRCAAYLDGTREAPPREQLLRAVRLLPEGRRGSALDIGCGPGKEVVELLRAGFQVTAIDPYQSMVDLTESRVLEHAPAARARLGVTCARIEDFAPNLPASGFDLVHAGFVLPFVAARNFERVFDALRTCVAPSGLFAGQFFGPDDEFLRTSPAGSMTSHRAGEVPPLLRGFEIIEHQEVNRAGFIGSGRPKWWHVHHVIARRIP